ncbi:MAG TPA: Hsp70 family protein [Kineosporiaceae bacterium]|nr:Hsp70 family protein [Kineosporiaceae bacterium]
MGYGLGVDLGTSFTGVAIGRYGRTHIVPLSDDPIAASSLVAVRPPGSLLVREVDDTVPVVLGGRPYPAVAVLAETLRSVLASVTMSEGETPEQVVLTCPAVWGPPRRQQFGEVSRRVGLTSVTVVSEPEAAVTSLVDARRLVQDDVVAVFDIGGVTVDMTVVRVTDSGMEILGLPESADGAGGADFDDLLLAHVDREVGGALSELDLTDPVAVGVLTGVRAECVRAKEALSRVEAATVRVIGLAEMVGAAAELDPIQLTRADFEALIRGPLTSTLAGLNRVLDSAGVHAADLTAVVLVGGSSRIPLVARLLRDSVGRPVLVDEHPQHCVALGAAAIADGTSTIADGVRRITPGAPPITDSIPMMVAAAKLAAAAPSAEAKAPAEAAGGKPDAGAKPDPGGKAETGATQGAGTTPDGSTSTVAVPSPFIPPFVVAPAAVPTPFDAARSRSAGMLAFPGGGAYPGGSPFSGGSAFSGGIAFQGAVSEGSDTAVDVTAPVLPRRAGGHRMPRVGDWRRWVGSNRLAGDRLAGNRFGVLGRRWQVIAATALTVLLIGGAAYAFSPLGGGGSDLSAQAVGSPHSTGPAPESTATSPVATSAPDSTRSTTSAPIRTKAPAQKETPDRKKSRSAEPTPSASAVPVRRSGRIQGLGGRCLDVDDGRAESGTAVQIFDCNGSAAQTWSVMKDGTLRALNKCLQTVDVGRRHPRVQIKDCTGRGNQQWVVSSGVIVNPRSAECLDVLRGRSQPRTPVITADCGGGARQSWWLQG